jgi:arylsulfatase A
MRYLHNIFRPFYLLLIIFSCNKKDDKLPNIILILADDLGYNDLSSYRNFDPDLYPHKLPTAKTPNIDIIAKQGMRFTDFYAGASVCSPSRASLITGRNATRVGVYNWIPENSPMHLRSSEITIAELLKNKEYQTGHFGKWHLTSYGEGQPLPNDQGYDYAFFSYNNASPSYRNPENYYRNGVPAGNLEGYACDLVVKEAMEWMDNRNYDSPFYINIWFNEPHRSGISFSPPFATPQELVDRHEENAVYYAAVENMDMAVVQIIEYLKVNNLDDNTILIFTSDNGSQWDRSNDPLRGAKHFNYEGGVRVPFIIRWPLKIPQGGLSNMTGSFTDILPSLASITGIPVPTGRVIDGIDISPSFFDPQVTIEREIPVFFYRYFHEPILMLRIGDWCLLGYDELIRFSEVRSYQELAKIGPWRFEQNHMEYLKTLEPQYFELYNLVDDKEQQFDLADKFPDIVEEMKNKMIELQHEMIEEGGNWYDLR